MRSSRHRQWFAIFCIALVLGSSDGFRILSQQSLMTVVDGNPHENMQFTVLAEASDFGQTYAATFVDGKNNTQNMTITFNRPNITTSAQIVGYIPRRKLLVTRTIVIKEDSASSSAYVQAYSNDSMVLSSAKMGPIVSLLGKDKAKMLMSHDHYHSRFVAAGLPRQSLPTKPVFKEQVWGAIAALVLGVGMAYMFAQSGRASSTGAADYQAAVDAQNARLDSYQKAIDGMNTKVLDIFDNVQAVQEKQAQIEQKTQDQIRNLTDFTTGLFMQANSANLEFADSVTKTYNAYKAQMQDNIDSIYNVTVNISAALNESFALLDNKLVNFSSSVDTRFSVVNDSIVLLTKALNEGVALTASHFEDVTGMIRDAIGIMRRFNAKIDLRVLMPNLFTASKSVWAGQGSVAFIDDQGLEGNETNPLFYKTMIDKVWITYVYNQSSTVVRQVSEQIRYYCNTDVIIFNTVALNTFQDVFTGVGPPGCNANNGSCSCWTEHSYASCQLKTTALAYLNETWFQNAMYVNSSLCVSAPSVEPITQVTDPATFELRLRYPHCQNQPSFGGFYRVFSYQGGAVTNVPWVDNYCNMTLPQISQGYTRIGYIWKIGDFLSNGYAASNLYIGDLIMAKHGRISNDVTFQATQYREADGAFATAETFGYLVVPDAFDWLPVYRLSLVSSSATFSVSFNGNLYSFSNGAVVSPVLGISSSDVRYVVGNPRNTTIIYDIPTDLISVVNNTYAQYDKVTCMICENDPTGRGLAAAGCDRAAWNAKNGVDFDAFHCSVAASLFETGLDSDGVCVGQRQPGSGSWCEIRDHYTVSFRDQSGPVDQITLGMKDGSFVGTMTLPTGRVLQQFTAACPNVAIDLVSPTLAALKLTNTQPNNLLVRIVRYGEPCTFNMTATVGPTSTTKILIDASCVPTCNLLCQQLNPGGVISYLMVSAIDPDGNAVSCNSEPLVVENGTAAFATIGLATPAQVDQATVVTFDSASTISLKMVNNLVRAMYQMMYTNVKVLATSGVPITPYGMQLSTGMAATLSAIAAQAADDAGKAHNQTWPSLDDAYNKLKKDMDDMASETETFMRNMNNSFAEVQGDLTTLTGLLDLVNQSITDGRVQASVVKTAGEAYYNATVNASKALVSALTNIKTSSLFDNFLHSDIGEGLEGAVKWTANGFEAMIKAISGGLSTGFAIITGIIIVGAAIGSIFMGWVLYRLFAPMCKSTKEKKNDIEEFMRKYSIMVHYSQTHNGRLPDVNVLRAQLMDAYNVKSDGMSNEERSESVGVDVRAEPSAPPLPAPSVFASDAMQDAENKAKPPHGRTVHLGEPGAQLDLPDME